MNIYETKSKYFKNSNQKFANIFSSGAVTIVLILIGIVVLYSSVLHFVIRADENRLNKNVETWMDQYGFKASTKFNDPMNMGEAGNTDNFEYFCRWLYNPKLNHGDTIWDARVTAKTISYSDKALKVDDISINWKGWGSEELGGGKYRAIYVTYTISSWIWFTMEPAKYLQQDTLKTQN